LLIIRIPTQLQTIYDTNRRSKHVGQRAISVFGKPMQKRPCMITYKIVKTIKMTHNFLIQYKHFYFIFWFDTYSRNGLALNMGRISFTFSVPVESHIYLSVTNPIPAGDKKLNLNLILIGLGIIVLFCYEIIFLIKKSFFSPKPYPEHKKNSLKINSATTIVN
jgi:hypothetical protein